MTKSKPQIKIIDCTTGEEIVRDATVEEIAQIEIDVAAGKAIEMAETEKEMAKQAILDRIGLTADELKMILG
jgi:hypothetical protein